MTTKTISNPNRTFLLIFLFYGLFSYAQTPGWQWAKRVGSFNDNAPFTTGDQNERFNDIKVDTLGNVYAVGEFFQNSAFDNQTTGFPTTGGYGDRDAYLVKFNKCGKTLWWRRMGGTGYDAALSLALDGAGKVIISGFCAPTFTLGGSSMSNSVITTGSVSTFIARFDTAGNYIDRFSGSGGNVFISSQGDYFVVSQDLTAARINTLGVTVASYTYAAFNYLAWIRIRGIVMDKNDNIYLSGFITNSVVIGGATVTHTNVSPGLGNSLIAKFTPGGTLAWVKSSMPSGGGGDILGKCTVDTSSSKFITGGRATLGTSVFGYTLPPGSPLYANVFYVFDSSTGNLISATSGSITYQEFMSPVTTDSNNKIHCAGTIGGSLIFSTGTYTSNPLTGTRQGCIGIYDIISNTVSVKMLPQTGSNAASVREAINSMAVDKQGNIYACGMFGGTLDSLGTAVNIIGGNEDGFIAKYGYPCGSTPTGSVPNVPLALAAANNNLTNNVTWTDNSNNENNFELHYTISPSVTYSLLATLPANTTSYAHTGLSYATTYCYKVAATNTVGMSVFSNTDCATSPAAPPTTTVPNAPLNLSSANNGSLTNNVSWTDNSSNETNFELHYTSGGSPTYSLLATLPANTTSYPHTGLTYTTNYCYKVAATNTIGMSAFSNTDCATTPAAPTNTTETGIAKNTADSKMIVCYPNPASTELYFDVPATADIEIYNALGSLVLTRRNYANRSVIDISELSRGMYYYKIKTARNEFTGKVVKE